MAQTDQEIRMTIKTLAAKGLAKRAIARQLSLAEGTVRYHLRRLAMCARDGRARQVRRAAACRNAIAHWMSQHGEGALNIAALHEWLRAEHGYGGSLRSVQRFVAEAYPPPRIRARRRVETPPGAQAQVDWAQFPDLIVAGVSRTLHAFHMVLSHSRHDAIVWMPAEDQLCWLAAHNGAFTRLGGIPAVVRVDNAKTAVAHGAGAWGTINATYRRYALTVRFHIDPCAPYSPEHKGKVERAVRTQRWSYDPGRGTWDSIEELQAYTDAATQRASRSRCCPITGTSVWEAFTAEREHLSPLPPLPVPFDLVATRQVGRDGLIAFEGRQYSVPFVHVGQQVEVRGGAGIVQILTGNGIVAEHERGTAARLVLNPHHYEGADTERVLAPLPLGRLGRRLQELAQMPVQRRPVDLYAALAELAR